VTGAGTASGVLGSGRASARSSTAGGPGALDSAGLPRRVHPALLRAVLYAGVERPVIALEGTIAAALVFTVGPRLVTLAVIVAIVVVIHPAMAWATSRDPLATAIYVRSLRWRDYYAPHGTLRHSLRTRGRVSPTLPRF
jgi:type IV secretory pathway TrbD component